MENIEVNLSPDKFDKAVHGGLDKNPVLPENGDLAIYVKPNATVEGCPMAVITFTVSLPDGTHARAQVTTTLALLEMAFNCIRGWRSGGHI